MATAGVNGEEKGSKAAMDVDDDSSNVDDEVGGRRLHEWVGIGGLLLPADKRERDKKKHASTRILPPTDSNQVSPVVST